MKIRKYLFLALSCVFLLISCEENGLFFPASSQANGVFEVTFDGTTFTTSSADFTTDGEDIFMTATKTETNEVFTIKVDDFDLDSYSFEGESVVASYIQNDPVSADIWTTAKETSSKGNIEFTDIDFVKNTVSGTFNFIAKNGLTGSSKAFTNGTFTNIPASILPVTNNTFSAKVDGVVFEEVSLFGNLASTGGVNLIMITANKSLTQNITISLPFDISVGEYDFGGFASQTEPAGIYNFDGGIYIADGKITITNHDTTTKLISGTFQFDASPVTSATPNFSITEGEFSISY